MASYQGAMPVADNKLTCKTLVHVHCSSRTLWGTATNHIKRYRAFDSAGNSDAWISGRRTRTWAARTAAPLKAQAALLCAFVRHTGREQEQVRAADACIYAGRRGQSGAAV